MQLTNIFRDVLEDRRLGRVYLPRRLLAQCGAQLEPHGSERELTDPQNRIGIRNTVRALLAEARGYYRSGDRGLSALPFRCAIAVRVARLLYAAIGTKLALTGFDPLRGRAITPASWKVVLVARALVAAVFDAPRRILTRKSRPRLPLLHEVRYPEDVLPL
jgi:phytoene synthase